MNSTLKRILAVPAAAALALLLAGLGACGGGGPDAGSGGGSVSPPPGQVPLLSDTNGLWSGSNASAVVLPDGQAWLVSHANPAAPVLVRVDLAFGPDGRSLAGSGPAYVVGSDAPPTTQTVIGGSVIKARNLTLNTAGTPALQLALSYDSHYETPARTADLGGNWRIVGAAPGGQFTFDLQGRLLAGSVSGTGCSYSGNLRPHQQPINVFLVQVVETCGNTATEWQGVATLDASRNRLSASYVTNTRRGGLLTLQR